MRSIRFASLAGFLVAACPVATSAQDYAAEFNQQWGLRMIGADKALALGLDGSGVLVGVQDSGLYLFHPEFNGRVSAYSSDGEGGTVTWDPDGHGTHVAGIIAANRDGTGMHGVAPGASIMSLQIGDGGALTWSERARNSLRYGLANGARIFNASWGSNGAYNGFSFSLYESEPEIDGFRDVVNAGGVMVFANGNDNVQGGDLPLSVQAALPYFIPELQRGWLAVAAVGPTGVIASYSQHCSVAMLWCITAPGGDFSNPAPGLAGDGGIYSTYNPALGDDGSHNFSPDYNYVSYHGTSMAAPHVTGALAIAQQLYPNASAQQLRLLALHTATDIGAAGIDSVYGWGLLNIGNMVATASPEAGTIYARQGWGRQGVVNHIIDGLNPHASAARGGDWGYWVMPLGVAGTIDTTGAQPARIGAAGVTAGVEGSVAPDWYLKMFGAVSQSSVTAGGNTATDTGFHLGAQLVYETPTWFADATLGASLFNGAVDRRSAPGFGGTIISGVGAAVGTSVTQDWAQWAALRFGYHVEAGGAGTITPYLYGRLVNQQFSPFAETGSIAGLSGAASSSLTGELGLGLKWMGPAASTGIFDITPVLDVSYGRTAGSADRSVSLLGNSMSASAGAVGQDVLQVSASAEVGGEESPFQLKLGYTLQVQSGALLHSAGVKLMGSF